MWPVFRLALVRVGPSMGRRGEWPLGSKHCLTSSLGVTSGTSLLLSMALSLEQWVLDASLWERVRVQLGLNKLRPVDFPATGVPCCPQPSVFSV